MSYQVLARKYRPKNFDTLVGQEHVVRALTHALEQKRLHHAYLFTGTRGVGKTTLSRILAKSLNCIGADGNGDITARPCGVCEACTAIDAGRFIDYIEMDAASNRGVDEMAQLLEQAVYAPSNARFKVYMIDEVHMLTNTAFNSMLKTLEEPPEHVKFILATTDPQKIPVTVLSRCLQFNLKQMPPGHIVSHLENILGQEQIEFELPALRLLAQGAHGSMRDGLSLTDQAIAYAAGTVTLEAVQGMLGALDASFLIRLLDALALEDGAGLLAVADDMAARSLSYSAALQDLGSLLHRIALAQSVPQALPHDLPERDDVLRLAAAFDAEEVQLFYQIAVHGRNELGLAPDEFAGFSMTLLRMLAFRPGIGIGGTPATAAARPAAAAAPASRTTSATSGMNAAAPFGAAASPAAARGISPAMAALNAARAGGKSAPAAAMSRPSAPASTSTSTGSAPPWDEGEVVARPASSGLSGAAAQKKTESSAPPAAAPALALVPQTAPPQPAVVVPAAPEWQPLPGLDWDGNWPLLAAALPVRGVVQQLALQSELVTAASDNDGNVLHLRVPMATLQSSGSVDKLTAALSAHFGRPLRVTTEIGAVVHTASAQAKATQAERQRAAQATIENDPFVQTMMREFGATIVPGSVKPISLKTQGE
ncbi:MAG: DNA polymerase III subunit gamma/tau [Oxalobacteraceae bacterium]|nr:DNA polymerase III subunit gamma/tau [Oxalobacteraceae bacterium]